MSRIVILALLLACTPSKNTSDGEKSNPEEAARPTDSSQTATTAKEPKAAAPLAQTFEEGMQLICDSLEHVDAHLDPSERQKAVATWIGENVTNPQVRELFSIMGEVPPSKRAGMMKAAATKAGISKCAIAEQ